MRLGANLRGVLGLFGGTFDPVHHGHLRTAYELKQRLGLDRVHFIPAAEPPHRGQPEAAVADRLKMLEAAIAGESGFVVDSRELQRAGPSYSIDTALSFREEFPEHVLCLLLGMDAFLGLPEWHRWESLLSLVNIVVARRPGAVLPESGRLGDLLDSARLVPEDTTSWPESGRIIVQDVTQLEISASDLRASIRAGIEPRYLLPDPVWRIIETTGCYSD